MISKSHPKYLVVASALIALSACDAHSTNSNLDTLNDLKAQFQQAQDEQENAALNCDNLTANAERVSAELGDGTIDITRAQNLNHITRAQERRYREEVAEEMGIRPSQADGWRQILLGRANAARADRSELEEELSDKQKVADTACAERDKDQHATATLADKILELVARLDALHQLQN